MILSPYSADVRCYRFDSPAGRLYLAADGAVLTLCDWEPLPGATVCSLADESVPQVVQVAACQLGEYFAGNRTAFDVPMRQVGSEFSRKVWDALTAIPYGEFVSYGMVAERIGMPRSVRAVASAVGRNRLNIFVGCHRVLAACSLPYRPGKNIGEYRGGRAAKQYLCALEFVKTSE